MTADDASKQTSVNLAATKAIPANTFALICETHVARHRNVDYANGDDFTNILFKVFKILSHLRSSFVNNSKFAPR